jgi:hypothetical protein
MKRRTSHEMMIGLFPGQFRYLWATLRGASNKSSTNSVDWFDLLSELDFKPVTPNRKVYVVKDHRLKDVPWSHFEFVTPPKSKPFFINKTLSVIQNRNKQRRTALLRRGDQLLLNKHAV